LIRKEDVITGQINQLMLICHATFAEPSSYNRFHINRIKDIIAGVPAYLNERETTRRVYTAHLTKKERLKFIADEFANMVWSVPWKDNFIQQTIMFRKEITSFEKALMWCEIAEVQLVPKGLMVKQ
jgi:hypothetical protein